MKPRFLIFVPVGFAVALLLIMLGPYGDVSASFRDAALLPFEESAADSAAEAVDRLGVLEQPLRATYRGWQWMDFGVAMANTLIIVPLLLVPALAIGVPGPGRKALLAIGLLPFVSEVLENSAIMAVVSAYPEPSAAAGLLGFATQMKWLTLAACGLLILIGWVAWIVVRLLRRVRRSG